VRDDHPDRVGGHREHGEHQIGENPQDPGVAAGRGHRFLRAELRRLFCMRDENVSLRNRSHTIDPVRLHIVAALAGIPHHGAMSRLAK
jgi:hypothetical protein